MMPDPAVATPSRATAALWMRSELVLGAFALWLLATLGVRPLLLPDEGRYAGIALEMLHGDAVVPTLHGLPFFHKPPLMYWLDMAAMGVFGVNEFAARIAPAVGAWLMGAALYLDLRRRFEARVAAIALGVLATAPFFFVGGQYANHDMLVAGWIAVAVVCGRRAVDEPRGVALRWLAAAAAAAALAVLTKGLIGVVLPLLVLLPWLAVQRRWRDALGLVHPLGLAVFTLVALPWFVAMQLRYPGFFDYFILDQHVRRFAQTGFNNMQPAWFFVPVVPLLMLPWSLWLTLAAWRWRALPGQATLGLYVWWALAVIGFFSMPASKIVGYVLPALAPLAGCIGVVAARGRGWSVTMPVAAVGCVAIVIALGAREDDSHRDVGLALAAGLQPQDRVVFVDGAYFDVPFYARMSKPPLLLADWDDPRIAQSDNWRRELADAARFDPAGAAERLWSHGRAPQLFCRPGTLWFVAPTQWQPPSGQGEIEVVLRGRHATLLRGTGRPGCA